MKRHTPGLIFFSFILLLSCSKPSTEHDRLHKITSSITYKSYYTLSKGLVPLIHSQASNVADISRVKKDDLRLLLAYSWATSQKNIPALAETALILDSTESSVSHKSLAHLVRSMVCINLNLMETSNHEFSLSNITINNDSPEYSQKYEQIMFHMIISIACIYNEKYDIAQYHLFLLSKITDINWPYLLMDGIIDIKKGNVQDGLVKLKKLQDDPKLPPEIRDLLAENIAKIEKKTGPVESNLFWLRAIGSVLYTELKNTGSSGLKDIGNHVEMLKEKLTKSK